MSITRIPSALLVLLVALPAAAQQKLIFPGQKIAMQGPTVERLDAFTLSDLDLDGVPDLVAAAYGPPTYFPPQLDVVLGLPGGGFDAPMASAIAGNFISFMVAGDLDGNAWPDVATATSNQRIVAVPGNGAGSFGTSYEYFSGNGVAVGIGIADVDHDGVPDIVTATDSAQGWINVNFGAAGGGYLATQAWTSGITNASLTLTDLNADGWTDVVTCGAKKLSVVLGDGQGGFLAPAISTTSLSSRVVLAGPLDGDADVDVLLLSADLISQDTAQAWLGDGTGALAPLPATIVGDDLVGGDLGDMDGDGDLDAAVVSSADQSFYVLSNDGTAHFTVDKHLLGWNPNRVRFSDATGDGVADLLVGTASWGEVSRFPALAPGVFPEGSNWHSSSLDATALAVAPLDGDDLPDIVASTDSGLLTFKGTATGFDATPLSSPGYAGAAQVAVSDLDGDAVNDVVCSRPDGTPIGLQLGHGTGNGQFDEPKFLAFQHGVGDARTIALPDFDGDGRPDIVGAAFTASDHNLLAFRNTGSASLSFAPELNYDIGPYTINIATGDLDGDGCDDVVGASPSLENVTLSLGVVRGDPSGVLTPPSFFQLPSLASVNGFGAVALGDIDLDGNLDAVVGCAVTSGTSTQGQVAIAYGDGAGNLAASSWLPPKFGASRMKIGDVDGDGWPDVLHGSMSQLTEGLALRRGDGAGGLLAPQGTATPFDLRDLALADLTHDGRQDLVTASTSVNGPAFSMVQLIADIADPFTWKDLGHALAGSQGEPTLVGAGDLLPGVPGFLRLLHAKPSSLAVYFASATSSPKSFKGGVLVPFPWLVAVTLFTDASGSLELAWDGWPASTGTTWYFQFAVQDPGAPHGVALSNAVSGTEPD